MAENQFEIQSFPSFTMRSRSSKRFILVFAFFVILIMAILAGLYILGSSQKKPADIKTVILTETPTMPLPTSSTSAVLTGGTTVQLSSSTAFLKTDNPANLDRSNLSLAVLNGSGEPGAARVVSTYLESLGYKIARVGNADGFTFKSFTVIVKSGKKGYAGLLKKDLQSNAALAGQGAITASVSASISDDISGDAVVIVGK